MQKILNLSLLGLGLTLTSCQSNSISSNETKQTTSKPEVKVAQEFNLENFIKSHPNPDAPKLVSKQDSVAIWRHHQRIYVTGSDEMSQKFYKYGHLPYTKTLLGAGPEGETVVFEVDKDNDSYAKNLISAFSKTPWSIKSSENFHIYKLGERLYVMGDLMTEKFEQHAHLPYTKTLLGAGPQGETVVFEVDKSNNAFADQLIKKFEETPWLLQHKKDFFVYKLGNRHYIIGDNSSASKFESQPHLPYTKTMIGEGPQGETLVFEVNKDKPELTDRLISTYFKK